MDLGKVFLGDNKACNIIGKGDVELSNSLIWKLKDVKPIPCLKKNLISVSQLAQSGYMTTFIGNLWKVIKGYFVMTCGNIEGSFI